MIDLLIRFAFLLFVLYGIAAALAYNYFQKVRTGKLANYLYILGFILLVLACSSRMWNGIAGSVGTGSGAGAGFNLIFGIILGVFGLLANVYPLYYWLDFVVGQVGRSAIGADQMVRSKTYDRAVGAD